MAENPTIVPSPKQHRAEPTVDVLVDATIAMLRERGVAGLRIEDLVRETGVSRGSLYHHFGSRDGLIDAAKLVEFTTMANRDLEAIGALASHARTRSELRDGLVGIAHSAHDIERRFVRLRRTAIIGASVTRPRLADALAEEQQRVTDRFAGYISVLQERGLVRGDLDPQVAAVFLQAIILGRVLDDISAHPVDPHEWASTVAAASVDFLMGPEETGDS
jgi:AcrR family transcriptional regulator